MQVLAVRYCQPGTRRPARAAPGLSAISCAACVQSARVSVTTQAGVVTYHELSMAVNKPFPAMCKGLYGFALGGAHLGCH
jgi:hypothetical protein